MEFKADVQRLVRSRIGSVQKLEYTVFVGYYKVRNDEVVTVK